MHDVVSGLIEEFRWRRNEISEPFTTVYLGGGTPSILPSDMIARLFDEIPVDDAKEITLEVNPEDVIPGNATLWKDAGINRISMGVQSLDDSILKSLGRRHTSAKALEAISTLHDAGITNISADLIYGLPGLTADAWRHALTTLFATGITHLSAYCLTYHEGTHLYKMWKSGKIIPADDDAIDLQFHILREEATRNGFEHYEISNLARPGFRSRHNSAYWDPGSAWLGIGPSAHSFDGKVRRIDYADTHRWLASLPAPYEIDAETPLDLVNDNIVTALRTADGLDLSTVPSDLLPALLDDAARFIAQGDMTLNSETNRLAISPARWLVSDMYIRELLR